MLVFAGVFETGIPLPGWTACELEDGIPVHETRKSKTREPTNERNIFYEMQKIQPCLIPSNTRYDAT